MNRAADCVHPAEKVRRVPGQLGPMLYDPGTGKHHAKVLTWAWHCDLCGHETSDDPASGEKEPHRE